MSLNIFTEINVLKLILRADDPLHFNDRIFESQNYSYTGDTGMNNPKIKLASECTSIWHILLILETLNTLLK